MPKKAFNYENTIIYKIVCNDLTITDMYVGHTTNFKQRKSVHKSDCINPHSKKYNYKIYIKIRENGGWNNWKMVEIEKFSCKDIYEATARERYWFELLNKPSLNVHIPSRNKQEWTIDNLEEIRESNRKYYETNKSILLEKSKLYRNQNKEELNKRKMTPCVCSICGVSYGRDNKSRHLKSKTHQNKL